MTCRSVIFLSSVASYGSGSALGRRTPDKQASRGTRTVNDRRGGCSKKVNSRSRSYTAGTASRARCGCRYGLNSEHSAPGWSRAARPANPD
jgi:hypothetical protein